MPTFIAGTRFGILIRRDKAETSGPRLARHDEHNPVPADLRVVEGWPRGLRVRA